MRRRRGKDEVKKGRKKYSEIQHNTQHTAHTIHNTLLTTHSTHVITLIGAPLMRLKENLPSCSMRTLGRWSRLALFCTPWDRF